MLNGSEPNEKLHYVFCEWLPEYLTVQLGTNVSLSEERVAFDLRKQALIVKLLIYLFFELFYFEKREHPSEKMCFVTAPPVARKPTRRTKRARETKPIKPIR